MSDIERNWNCNFMDGYVYFFEGLSRRRIPVTEVVLEIQSVGEKKYNRRGLTRCFVQKIKPILPLKAKANKKNHLKFHI